jgi:HKD family nuclease
MSNYFLSNRTKPTFLDMFYLKTSTAKEILISVSFIKLAGWRLIKKVIGESLEKGVEVKLITSTYKNFTDPGVLLEMLELQSKFTNFECRVDHLSFDNVGFHTKGYIFVEENQTSAIVGSTNLTRSALLTNFEWNALVEGNLHDPFFDAMIQEFDFIWEAVHVLTPDLIKAYELARMISYENWDMDYELSRSKIKPNKMQEIALKEINKNRKDKALVVAAMGTGKTYLGAMDAKAFGAKRVLFVVHRENDRRRPGPGCRIQARGGDSACGQGRPPDTLAPVWVGPSSWVLRRPGSWFGSCPSLCAGRRRGASCEPEDDCSRDEGAADQR